MRAMCRKLAEDELASGCKLCRLNYSSEAQRAVATFESLPVEQREAAAYALTKLQEERTESEQQMVEKFRNRMWTFPLASLRQMRGCEIAGETIAATGVTVLSELDLFPANVPLKLSKVEIKRLFLSGLRAEFEAGFKSVGASTYEVTCDLGSQWGLITFWDFGGHFQFRPSFLRSAASPGLAASSVPSLKNR